MASYYIEDMGNSQLWNANEASGQLANENIGVANWTIGDPFILITQVYRDAGGACNKDVLSTALKLQFKKDGAGSWIDVVSDSEISYTENTTLVNNASSTDRSLSSPQAGCVNGWIAGVECTDGAASHSFAKEYYSEIQWALDTDNAVAGVVYTFQVYRTGVGALNGSVALDLTIATEDVDVLVEPDVITQTLATYQADVNAEIEIDAKVSALSLATYKADIDVDVEIAVNAAALNLATYKASISTGTGWTGKVHGVTNPAKINGIAAADIAKVMGVA